MPKLGIPPSRFPDRQPIAELRLQTAARCRASAPPPPSSLRMTPPSLPRLRPWTTWSLPVYSQEIISGLESPAAW